MEVLRLEWDAVMSNSYRFSVAWAQQLVVAGDSGNPNGDSEYVTSKSLFLQEVRHERLQVTMLAIHRIIEPSHVFLTDLAS